MKNYKIYTICLLFILADFITTKTILEANRLKNEYQNKKVNQCRNTDKHQVICQLLADNLNIEINSISTETLQIIIRKEGEERFEMPKREPFPYHQTNERKSSSFENENYIYEIEENPVSITIIRKATKEIIFSTKNYEIIFKENYTELSATIPSENLYGLGERTTSYRLSTGLYTLYNRDSCGEIEDKKGGKNRYGSHPMYLMREKSENFHITYLRNSLPMDIEINHSKNMINYKIVGGIIDLSFFLGDKNPETAIKLYHTFLGGHILPPFWSMGFHQCRWGYVNLEMVKDVLEKYEQYNLPLDTIWLDIDYMTDYVPFTVDESRYNITEFKNMLVHHQKRFAMIAEPAMSIKWPDYEYLVKGLKLDIFIKNKEGLNLINKVWPGQCYFIDYFNPKSESYWHEALDALHDKLNFSGVWLDMNELATFEFGQVDETGEKLPCNDDTVYPYLPANQPLERNTICPNAVHHEGVKHFQVHNYLPVQQQMLTNHYLTKKFPDEFPFILSRANSAGTGKYSFHWTGDNMGNFEFYKFSISEVLNSNLFGIPMVGADICGFGDNTPPILCAKYYQLGSLYPFSRSHSASGTVRKEPWEMGDVLLQTTLKSLQFRYAILKFYYSLFIEQKGTGTIFKPLFFVFNDEEELLKDSILNSQFMIGSELLVIPNLNREDTEFKVNGYFPKGSWYDLRYNTQVQTKGGYLDIQAVLYEMPPVFLRGGKTIFTNSVENVRNSSQLNNSFNLLIAFDSFKSKESQGKIPALLNYNSKDLVNSCITNDCFTHIISEYDPHSKKLFITLHKAAYYHEGFSYFTISSFKFYGLNMEKTSIKSSNLDNLVESTSEKYRLEYINNDHFIIQINGVLKIKKDDIKIEVEFQNN